MSGNSTTFLGIDPGKSGGLALIDSSAQPIEVLKMPATERDLVDVLREFSDWSPFGVVEKVHAMPKNGSKSAFSLGKSFGSILAALAATSIPHEEVSPGSWKRELGVLAAKNATDTERKNIDKRKAQQFFPSLRITHATADALLLAEYARRRRA